jgi:hypothetical protein
MGMYSQAMNMNGQTIYIHLQAVDVETKTIDVE